MSGKTERVSDDRRWLKAAVFIVLNAMAVILLALGLIAGLTPSEGLPTVTEILIFAVLPLAIPVILLMQVRNVAVRVFLLLETELMALVLVKIAIILS